MYAPMPSRMHRSTTSTQKFRLERSFVTISFRRVLFVFRPSLAPSTWARPRPVSPPEARGRGAWAGGSRGEGLGGRSRFLANLFFYLAQERVLAVNLLPDVSGHGLEGVQAL